jgi:hypothetical protein
MFQKQQCDRFSPIRNGRDGAFEMTFSADKYTEPSTAYSRILSPSTSKYLKFATSSAEKAETLSQFVFESLSKKELRLGKKETRKAVRILDAP